MINKLLFLTLILFGVSDIASASGFGGARGTTGHHKKKPVCTKEEEAFKAVQIKCNKLRDPATMAAPVSCQREATQAKAALDKCKSGR